MLGAMLRLPNNIFEGRGANVFNDLKEYYWKHRWWLYWSIFFLVIATGLGVAYPFLLGRLIDDIDTANFDRVPHLALLVVVFIVAKAAIQYCHGFTGTRFGNLIAYNMRNTLYKKLQYLSFQYYDRAKTGDLMSRLTGDLDGIRGFMAFGFAQFLNVFIMVGIGMIAMAVIDWRLMLIALIPMPFLVLRALHFERQIHPAFRAIRISMGKLNTAVQENIAGVRTVKSFAREPFEVNKFVNVNEDYQDRNIHASGLWARFFPVMEFLANLCVVILVLVGGWFVINDTIRLGQLVTFSSLIWYIIGPLWGLGYHINVYTKAKASVERIKEITHHPIHIKAAEHAIELDPKTFRGEVEFRNVTFKYPDSEPALKNISFHAKPGSVIGILGGTGAGKSTLVQLLMRAYDVKSGQILLDGRDIREYTPQSVRERIGFVFQETFLFSSSIRNNIAYGRSDATMEDIERAARIACAHDFIMELPQGYDTIVGERGLGLSGGQKQRIAIARALVVDPKIIVFDDSTSAVDMRTEHEIQQALQNAMKGRTTFIIAHRISSLKHADEILVLDHGEIVQRGTHEELIQVPGHYRDTYDIQFSDLPEEIRYGKKGGVVNG